GVNAFTHDGPLPAALAALRVVLAAAVAQERAGILEVVAVDHAAERLAGLQRLTVAGVHVADLALRHRDQRDLVDAVLPAPVTQVEAAAEQVGLQARLVVQGDDAAIGHRPLARPQLLNDADAVVGDVAQTQQF